MPPLKVSKKHHKRINNPFPPHSTTFLPSIHGSLSFDPHHLPSHHLFPIGDHFHLAWRSTHGGSLSIAHNSQPNLTLWSTLPGQPFISAAVVQTQVEESRGSFCVSDGEVFFVSDHQLIDEIRVWDQCDIVGNDKARDFIGFEVLNFPVLVVTGLVRCKRAKKYSYVARYWFVLDQKNRDQVGFSVKFGDLVQQRRAGTFRKVSRRLDSLKWKLLRFRGRRFDSFLMRKRGLRTISSDDDEEEELKVGLFRELNRIFITYSSERDERFYGFGEQFSCMEFKGKRVPILVQEQGIGRGDQPITFAANLVSYRSGGDWSTTYAPSPFYMTSKMRSLYLEGYDYSVFDLRKHDRVQIEIYGNSLQGRILYGTSPAELIENFTETIGRPPELPDWILSGAIVGMQGGSEAVRRVWRQLQDHDVPISAFWLQDWVGQRETIIGSQLWWNWEVDNDHYAGWRKLVDDLRSCNIRVMTYCNPCLVPTDEKMNSKRDLFEEAKRLGILVKNNNGETYMIPNTTFDVGMLDFTHPETSGWFKKILHEMVDSGVRGWMADFGEGLPLDANIFSGEDPIAAHNQYPELWARANREFADEWKSSSDEKEDNLVFFMRAGFRGSSKWTMLLWEGDQMVSWQKNDGIKSSVTGLLSSGLSGFPLNHSDIGGYCAVNLPIIRYRRSEELLMRWMELNAFSTVFRTHEGNNPSINCQFYSNRSTLDHFARFAKVYKAWKFYRIKLVKEASERGLPVVRHLFIHYPDDEHVHNLSYQQFLVGTEFLVVPVLDKGDKDVKVYFPVAEGLSWQHIWTGKVFNKALSDLGHNDRGFEARVDAPIGYPAVFVKYGSHVGQTFLNNLRDLNVI